MLSGATKIFNTGLKTVFVQRFLKHFTADITPQFAVSVYGLGFSKAKVSSAIELTARVGGWLSIPTELQLRPMWLNAGLPSAVLVQGCAH